MIKKILTVCSIILLSGCVSTQKYTNQQYRSKPEFRETTLTMAGSQDYEFLINDSKGNPLSNVKIEYAIEQAKDDYYNYEFKEGDTTTTKPDGTAFKNIKIIPIITNKGISSLMSLSYETRFKYKASKKGYYSKTGMLSTRTKLRENHEIKNFINKGKSLDTLRENIILMQPTDYFRNEFTGHLKLKKRILKVIDLIVLEGLLNNANLDFQSINIEKFKQKNYLKFKFKNGTVYNSIQVSKYSIGKRLFDEVIRKILTPLNKHISKTKAFYGYDITVIGYTKKFTDEYAKNKPIAYRFIMPESVVRKYKNKDISGQKLLDKSIIVMDDERVELNLQ